MKYTPLLLLLGCAGDSKGPKSGLDDTGSPLTSSALCGNGVLDPGEACDDGAGNSDTAADACRTECVLAYCGDGVQDSGEACDDANAWGGDGCLPTCSVELGPFEVEPNDQFALGTPLPEAGQIAGAATEFDRDCFTVTLPYNAWLEAQVLPGEDGLCNELAILDLVDSSDTEWTVGAIDEVTGCAFMGPDEGARYLDEGEYALCLEGMFDSEIPAYRLEILIHEDSCTLTPESLEPEEDLDLDGIADPCDDDTDNDGLDDVIDNCPRTSNGPNTVAPTPNSDGYIGTWLALGPFENVSSEFDCMPDSTEYLGNDASTSPSLGDVDSGMVWHALLSAENLMDLDVLYPSTATPREGYYVSYVWSASARSVDLAIGQDDGARVWFNNSFVGEVSECQGASVDDYLYPVTLQSGWNQVMVRVYDGGGNWGLYTRFKDGGTAITDLELSLDSRGNLTFDQTDSDGDGLGDVCDPDPNG